MYKPHNTDKMDVNTFSNAVFGFKVSFSLCDNLNSELTNVYPNVPRKNGEIGYWDTCWFSIILVSICNLYKSICPENNNKTHKELLETLSKDVMKHAMTLPVNEITPPSPCVCLECDENPPLWNVDPPMAESNVPQTSPYSLLQQKEAENARLRENSANLQKRVDALRDQIKSLRAQKKAGNVEKRPRSVSKSAPTTPAKKRKSNSTRE